MSKGKKKRTPRRVKNPLVSIVTVCLNAERTIARTVESVLGQTYSRIEYIIIDGASTDGTLAIVSRYKSRFRGRMNIVSERDAGLYDAMNKGIRMSRGAIVGIINSDDWYEPDAVRLVVDSYVKHGEAVYYGIVRHIDSGREMMLRSVGPEFLDRESLGHPGYFVPKRLYDQFGMFRLEYRYAADYELIMRFHNRRIPFVSIDRVLSNFTEGGTSMKFKETTFREYLQVRAEYGYISGVQKVVAMYKYRILSLLRRLRMMA